MPQHPDLRELFPSTASSPPPRLAVNSHRILLVAPADAGKTSMLLQLALNRARRGLSSLLVSCGPADGLALHLPARPRLSSAAPSDTTASSAARAGLDSEESKLLRLVHIKYVATWPELQQVLASIHLPEARPAAADSLPHSLLIDGLSSLFTSRFEAAAGGPGSQAVTPSPSKPEQQSATMFLALALAMAAHAADHLDSVLASGAHARATAGTTTANPASAAEPALLVVACSRRHAPEPELAARWLPTLLQAAPASSPREGRQFVVTCRRTCSTRDEGYCRYVHEPATELKLLDSGRGAGGGMLVSGGVMAGAVMTPVPTLQQRQPPTEHHSGNHETVGNGTTGGRSASPLASGPLASAVF